MFVSLPTLDLDAMAAAAMLQDRLAKPPGSLGRLEGLGVWLAGVQQVCPPRQFQRPRVVVFAGDHGVVGRGVSVYPQQVTGQMLSTILAGGAAVNVFADGAGAGVKIVDMSVNGRVPGDPYGISENRVRDASGSIDVEDAMTPEQAQRSWDVGLQVADAEVDEGADLLIAGDMGIGNTTAAAVILGVLTDTEPVKVVGRGTGIDDEGWKRKVTVIRDAMRRVREAGASADVLRLLTVAGGPDLAAMTSFLVRAAERRTPVVLDGVVPCVCALLADRVAPGIGGWQVAGTRSPEPAQRIALERLRLEPLLDLGLRLGEGTGALLTIPLLRASIAVMHEMATFESAGVSGPA